MPPSGSALARKPWNVWRMRVPRGALGKRQGRDQTRSRTRRALIVGPRQMRGGSPQEGVERRRSPVRLLRASLHGCAKLALRVAIV